MSLKLEVNMVSSKLFHENSSIAIFESALSLKSVVLILVSVSWRADVSATTGSDSMVVSVLVITGSDSVLVSLLVPELELDVVVPELELDVVVPELVMLYSAAGLVTAMGVDSVVPVTVFSPATLPNC